VNHFGRLDAAFNNAGMSFRPTPLADLALGDFERLMAVNATGVFLAMKYEIPAMIDAGGGAIVNMASTAGMKAVPGIAPYVASKHAVIGLTKVAALDYAAQGVRVNALAPGPIDAGPLTLQPAAVRAQAGAAIPVARIGRPEEVARAAAWLCSAEALFITGAVLPVDGGQLAR
jgi:NAD(P)-dependent dehydrogenase (short-subunit alcohol dehydrogenase family)